MIIDHSKRILSWVAFCLLAVALPASAASVSPSLMSVLAQGVEGGILPVIVTFVAEENPSHMARRMGRGGRSDLVRELKDRSPARVTKVLEGLAQNQARQIRHLWLIDGVALEATAAEIEQLAQLTGVASISFDETITMPEIFPAQAESVEWNIARTGAPELWSRGYTGEGVTIAILDSGVDVTHPELMGRWRGLPGDWFDPYGNSLFPYDFGDYHGSAVASIAVGGHAGGSAIGMSPGSNLIAGKIFRDDGTASNSSIIEVLQWVLNPGDDPDQAPHIVNVSWGFEDSPDECLETLSSGYLLRNAFQTVRASGIFIVAAAGNSGPNPFTSTSPANFSETIAVGATDSNNLIASFSARGPSACSGAALYPDLVAPGVHVWAAGQGSSYRILTGTSFATAHVSGALALMMQATGTLLVDEVERSLTQSATDLGATGADDTYGHGLVNLQAALELAESLPNSPPPKPALIFPANDAMLDGTQSVELRWSAVTDADGDEVTYTLLVADNLGFVGSKAYSVAATGVLLSGIGLLFGLRRFRRPVLCLMLIVSLGYFVSCGGGGGGSGDSPDSGGTAGTLNVTIDDLERGATYYWKVRVEDDRGAVTESDVRTFTVE